MACEILIRDKVNQKATIGDYESGDIVFIKDYPNVGWGRMETQPLFVIVRITDASAEEVKHLKESYVDEITKLKIKNNQEFDTATALIIKSTKQIKNKNLKDMREFMISFNSPMELTLSEFLVMLDDKKDKL